MKCYFWQTRLRN